MLKFLFRFVLFVFGLVLAASLATAVLLLASLWLLRAGWARLTGRPVTPWVMRFDPRAGFGRFNAAASAPAPSAADVSNRRARGEAPQPAPARPPRGRQGDIVDAVIKPIVRTD